MKFKKLFKRKLHTERFTKHIELESPEILGWLDEVNQIAKQGIAIKDQLDKMAMELTQLDTKLIKLKEDKISRQVKKLASDLITEYEIFGRIEKSGDKVKVEVVDMLGEWKERWPDVKKQFGK